MHMYDLLIMDDMWIGKQHVKFVLDEHGVTCGRMWNGMESDGTSWSYDR